MDRQLSEMSRYAPEAIDFTLEKESITDLRLAREIYEARLSKLNESNPVYLSESMLFGLNFGEADISPTSHRINELGKSQRKLINELVGKVRDSIDKIDRELRSRHN
jgi:hypothetical protein